MILDDILRVKREALKKGDYRFCLEDFLESLRGQKTEGFKEAIEREGLSIIGEVKKASPSRGLIRKDFEPVEIARDYEGAVDCISVLTEEHFFQGSPSYLAEIHREVTLPLLRKDFIISPLQILEARELGASAVLLIASVLDETTLREFIRLSHGLSMDALVEVHNEEELYKALDAEADIIGVNNRNLYDFTEDIQTTVRMREKIPKGIAVVSESSIHTAKDIRILKETGVDAVLVGESFMRCADIKEKAREFRDAYGN